jgi:hypothetical protein
MPEPLKLTDVVDSPKRKFARELNPEPVEAKVRCRITRRGADKISTGRHEPMLGDEKYAEGEIVELPLSIALEQQDALDAAGQPRGYVEIIS